MLRSAAKNHAFVTVVTNPADYARVLEEPPGQRRRHHPELRRELAFKVFAQQARYDGAIAAYLASQGAAGSQAAPFICVRDGGETLRYGENPTRMPCSTATRWPRGLHRPCGNPARQGDVLQQLTSTAMPPWRRCANWSASPGVAIIKHSNPCGFATGKTLAEAFEGRAGRATRCPPSAA
jgi:phosphoribosylaminoimidazolecarboxamide formyltransferase/IMP cyclohydrolase